MPTAVTKTIGVSTGDYSTLATAWAALPSDLVASDQNWVFKFKQEGGGTNGEFTVTALTQLTAKTTDATRNILITADTGKWFGEHASKATNALRYNNANGVAIKLSGGAGVGMLQVSCNYVTMERLQLLVHSDGDYYNETILADASGAGVVLQDMIIARASYNAKHIRLGGGVKIMRRCLVQMSPASAPGSANSAVVFEAASHEVHGCTLLATSSVSMSNVTAFTQQFGGTPIVKNTAFFGFGTGTSGSFSGSSGYNATDKASAPGSSNQVSLTVASQIENQTTASFDARAKAGGALVNAGVADATNNATDVVGQTRNSPPYIGAFDIVSAAPSITPKAGIYYRRLMSHPR